MKFTFTIAILTILTAFSNQTINAQQEAPAVGFNVADANNDSAVSPDELKSYLRERLGDSMPFDKFFKAMDADQNGSVSSDEFDRRHEVIENVMGEGFFGFEPPEDPGADFVPFQGTSQPIDDKSIYGAAYNRYFELLEEEKKEWQTIPLEKVPMSIDKSTVAERFKKSTVKSSVEELIKATAIVCGGEDEIFTAGAVIISEDGLAVTNYHVAESMASARMMAMTSDGKRHRVLEFLAGNAERDVALIRLEGEGFNAVKVATQSPGMGDDIVMMHHSENRFYTYDRGYVMRHPKIGDDP